MWHPFYISLRIEKDLLQRNLSGRITGDDHLVWGPETPQHKACTSLNTTPCSAVWWCNRELPSDGRMLCNMLWCGSVNNEIPFGLFIFKIKQPKKSMLKCPILGNFHSLKHLFTNVLFIQHSCKICFLP